MILGEGIALRAQQVWKLFLPPLEERGIMVFGSRGIFAAWKEAIAADFSLGVETFTDYFLSMWRPLTVSRYF